MPATPGLRMLRQRLLQPLRARDLQLRIGVLLAVLAAGIVLWLTVDRQIARERDNLDRAMSAAVRSKATDYAQYLTRSIDQMDQVTMHLKYDWERSGGTLRLRDLVERGVFTSPQFVDVAITDRNGLVVSATTSALLRTSIARERFFDWHRSNISSALHVSGVGGEIRFTRRLDTPGDDFDGVIVVTVDIAYFTAFYDRVSLGKRGLLAVVDSSGVVHGARIGVEGADSADIGDANEHALRRVPRFGSVSDPIAFPWNGEKWLSADWFADDDSRLVAWRSLPAYPLTVMVGLSRSEQFAAATQRWNNLQELRWFGEAVLLTLAVFAARAGSRMSRARRMRASVNAAYRLATEVGDEAFYMMLPLRGEDGTIVDFRILDCNERGAAFFGLSKPAFIGSTLSSLYTQAEFLRLRGVYQKAYDTGAYREEVAFHAPGNSGIQWIRRKIARSGDELAVTLRDISQAKLQEGELIRLASTDELTGLANRSSFISLLEEAIDEAAATNREIALLFIDLDRFKAVNDSFGHSSGDIVLRQAADRLRAALRPTDHVARLGGDEFTAILRQHGGDADVLRVADRILHALTQPYRVADTDMDIGASIGICVYPRDGDTAEQLLRHADIAMYAAKTGGRGGYCFYRQELYEELRKRMDIERELAEAIQDDQFELYYQPRIEAATGRLVSMEALLRWRHPERGIVPPLEFIPIAEGNGQIVKIGALVIRKACEQLAAWQAAGHAVVPVSVNVSAVQFQHSDIGDILATALRMSGVASDMVELEITESAMLGEHAAIVSRLSAMRRLGVKLAVDDFGTGYSSLAQLQRLDMDVLKVDRSFTAGIEDSHEGRILYRAIVSMAHALGMHVVAEGVETWAQARLLRDIGCDELQGYLISKPVPAEEATTFLRRGFRFPALFTSSQSQLLPARESNVIAL